MGDSCLRILFPILCALFGGLVVPAVAQPFEADQIEVFVASRCPHCEQAIEFLEQEGRAFKVYNLEDDVRAEADYLRSFGRGILPVVRYRGEFIRSHRARDILTLINKRNAENQPRQVANIRTSEVAPLGNETHPAGQVPVQSSAFLPNNPAARVEVAAQPVPLGRTVNSPAVQAMPAASELQPEAPGELTEQEWINGILGLLFIGVVAAGLITLVISKRTLLARLMKQAVGAIRKVVGASWKVLLLILLLAGILNQQSSDVCREVSACEEARERCWALHDAASLCHFDDCVHQLHYDATRVMTKTDSCQNTYILCKRRIWRASPDAFNECNRDMEAYDAGEASDIKGDEAASQDIE